MVAQVVTSITVPAYTQDLTTLATVLDDYGLTPSDSNDVLPYAFLRRAITRCSAAVESYCNRRFAAETIAETIYSDRDAFPYQTPGGLNPLQLSRWPLLSVTSVVQQDAGTSTTLVQFPSSDPTQNADYVVMPNTGQLLRLDSFGEQMTWPAVVYAVTYQAGYVLPVDPWAAATLYIAGNVVSAAGNLYQTTSGGTSGSTAPTGTGASISDGGVTWGYIGPAQTRTLPMDLEDAVGRLVYLRYAERRRDPYIRSQAVASGGTTSYWGSNTESGNFTPDILDILDKYRVPVVG